MRKFLAPVTVAGILGLALVGCSSSPSSNDDGCERTLSASQDAIDLVTVEGDTDDVPEIEAYTPIVTSESEWTDIVEGDGSAVRGPDQAMVIDVALYNGATGEQIATTPYDGSLTSVLTLAQWTQSFPGFEDALVCAREGGRVATVLAGDGLNAEAAAGFGIEEGGSAIAVVDLRKVYLDKADGADQFVAGHNLPTVVRAPDGRPGIIVPESEPPADLQVEVLKKGDGEVVTGDAPVRVHYTGVLWDEGTVFDSSWENGAPVAFELDGVVEGFGAALEGQTVGSQILAVIPPDLGYGDQANGSIPAGSTLVFVVDILGIDAPAE